MGKFTVEIEMGNDAMSSPEDVAAKLESIARTLRRDGFAAVSGRRIADANGNTVGMISVKES